MYWLVHPSKPSNGSSDGVPGLTSYPSFQGNRGKIPSRLLDEDESGSYDDIPMNKSLDFAISHNKHLHEQEKAFSLEVLRLKTQKFMASSWLGHAYMNFFLVVSIFSCGQYIYQTYLTGDSLIRTVLTYIEIILAGMFFFDWCLSLFLAEQRWDHFWSFFALVDFATIVPTMLVNIFFRHRVTYYEIQNFHDALNYFAYGAYSLRILRALKVQKKLNLIKDEVDRFLYSMLLSVITMVLFDAAVMQYLEAHVQNHPFQTWMYYTVVTICTVGYGDLSPISPLGRLACMCIILFAIVYLPQQTNELIEKMNIFSVYSRRNYTPIGQAKHIVICGDLRTTFLSEFFQELFHEDHENINLNAVVLQPESPSPEMHAILNDTTFGIVVHYLAGSPLNNADLLRARVDTAVAVLIMGNKFSLKPDEDDAKTILQYFSIQRFLRAHHRLSDPLFCLQLIRPDNQRHLGATASDEDSKEIIICLNEMKMGLIAKTCMFPGTNTLIFNLLTSFADTGEDIEDEDENEELEKLREETIENDKKILEQKLEQLKEGSEEGSDDENSTINKMKILRQLSRNSSNKSNQNISRSFKSLDENDSNRKNRNKNNNSNNNNNSDNNNKDEDIDNEDLSDSDSDSSIKGAGYWMNEYQRGCDWEIYTTEMADKFEGVKFIDLARTLYTKLGVVLFALRITDLNLVTNRVRVVLNPADFIIPPKTRSIVEGFILAKNQASANLSFTGVTSFESSHLESIANSLLKNKPSQTQVLRKRVSISSRTPILATTGAKPGVGWHTLIGPKGGALQQEEMHQSRQEREQKLEDENLRNNYFIRDSQVDIQDCTIKSSILEEYPFIRDHMIVIAKGISNLYDFIRPLRAKYLGKLKHIVILFPFDIPINIWRKISRFEGILFVRGSPLEENDIKRAGIFRAAQVVVLADPDANATEDNAANVDALVDADAIFTYNCVKRLNEKAQIVIEVVRQQNISYLESKSSDIDYKFTPNFACGMLFTSSMLDAVVCQAFYNPQIMRILNKLISGTDHVPEKGTEKTKLVDKSHSRAIGLKSISGSSLYQIPIPSKFHMKTYGQVFDHYAREDCICIALFRGLPDGSTIGPCANRLPYVYTNPSITTVVYRWDCIFILSQKVLTSTNSSIKEVLESFAHANNYVSTKRNIDGEDQLTRREIGEISSTQRVIEKALTSLTVEVANRFDDLYHKQKSLNEVVGGQLKKLSSNVSDSGLDNNNNNDSHNNGNSNGNSNGKDSGIRSFDKLPSKTYERTTSRPVIDKTPSKTIVDRSNSRSVRIKEEIQRRKSIIKKAESTAEVTSNIPFQNTTPSSSTMTTTPTTPTTAIAPTQLTSSPSNKSNQSSQLDISTESNELFIQSMSNTNHTTYSTVSSALHSPISTSSQNGHLRSETPFELITSDDVGMNNDTILSFENILENNVNSDVEK